MIEVYEAAEHLGNCMVCRRFDDLRYGVCFDCSDKVDGCALEDGGGHELWERARPENRWKVRSF